MKRDGTSIDYKDMGGVTGMDTLPFVAPEEHTDRYELIIRHFHDMFEETEGVWLGMKWETDFCRVTHRNIQFGVEARPVKLGVMQWVAISRDNGDLCVFASIPSFATKEETQAVAKASSDVFFALVFNMARSQGLDEGIF